MAFAAGALACLLLGVASLAARRGGSSHARHETERRRYELKLERSNAELERLTHSLGLARDLAERESRAKTRFLAGMSHELRTPLNGILGYAQLLRLEAGLNQGQLARLDCMLDAGRHLLQMIHCVLDLSQIETERVEMQLADVDLQRVAAACLDLVRPTAEGKALSLVLKIAHDVPDHIVTDPTRLRQVLLNLLGNAVKFTSQGSVELRLMLTGGGTTLRFEVADTGPGIPLDRRHRLFQEFARLDAEATKAVEGAGLGLAISSRLAVIMGGPLGYLDNPAGGSLFWMELPLTASAEPVAAATHNGVTTLTASGAPAAPGANGTPEAHGAARLVALPAPPDHPWTVLVVDDIAMNRDIAGSFIRAAGHAVVCVDGGAEAVEAVSTARFDVVMMDIRMPMVDGLEATRRIRALVPPDRDVPIVAMTAQVFSEQVRACRDAGMDHHLAKPFTMESLLEAIARGIAAGQARSEADVHSEHQDTGSSTPREPAEPVFDQAAFERTSAFLDAGAVASHLRTLAERSETLLRGLRAPGALATGGHALAESAHALAGSAGMFGFARVALIARQFQHAVEASAPETTLRAVELCATLEATILEMRRLMPLTAEASAA
jgi:signal transduction histidine kinase/CheY-like chemotaxis protein/HPt (histidine-containing phosphotransfer) domain-containing protein